MIFDCFIFGQKERAILHLRIDTMCGTAEHTIISQGTTSLSGAAHTPFLDQADIAGLRARCKTTALHVVLVETKHAYGSRKRYRSWHALNHQSMALIIKARQLGMRSSDLVLVTEHDEIPNPAFLHRLIASNGMGHEPRTAKLRTAHYYVYHGACSGGYDWNAGFIANGAALDLLVDQRPNRQMFAIPKANATTMWKPGVASSDSDRAHPLVVDNTPFLK